MAANPDATAILERLSQGSPGAVDQLLPLVYDEMRAMAAGLMRDERAGHTLQPTAIVHEAYLRMVDQTRADWKGRAHFLSVAAMVIRRVLVDHVRERGAAKRGGGRRRVTLADVERPEEREEVDLAALDDALRRLAELHDRQSRVVTLRYFGGLTAEETALVLGVSRTTVCDDWTIARAWLSRALSEPGA